MHRYSEQIIRHQALTEDGKACEILERITHERVPGADEPVVVTRRYDLRTGERVNRMSEMEFEEDLSGARLHLQR